MLTVPDTLVSPDVVAAYDELAPAYDRLFSDPGSLAEDAALLAHLGDLSGLSVLDVGCGTGWLLDHAAPAAYVGIDPSHGMLDQLIAKHPNRAGDVSCVPLRDFVGGRFDLVVALFGVASYLRDEELARIPGLLAPGGRYVLMFYMPDYYPRTHREMTIPPSYRTHLPVWLGPGHCWGNYLSIEGPA